MIYTPKTVLAMNIAYDAHNGTYDKNGVLYIFYPFHLAEQMKDEDSTIVALFHDTMEETPPSRSTSSERRVSPRGSLKRSICSPTGRKRVTSTMSGA